jgi:hypothetical protein
MSRIKEWMMGMEELAWANYADHHDPEKLITELCECGWHEDTARAAYEEFEAENQQAAIASAIASASYLDISQIHKIVKRELERR